MKVVVPRAYYTASEPGKLEAAGRVTVPVVDLKLFILEPSLGSGSEDHDDDHDRRLNHVIVPTGRIPSSSDLARAWACQPE